VVHDDLALALPLQSEDDACELFVLAAVELCEGDYFLEALLEDQLFVDPVEGLLESEQPHLPVEE
jgi:hypothetical protein